MARTLRRTSKAIEKLPVLAQRQAWENIAKLQPNSLTKEVQIESVDAGGVPARWITPNGLTAGAPTLVYLHGGGYRYGSYASHGEIVCRIAKEAGARALFVEYRLCPEHRFPAAFHDALTATKWVLHQTSPSRVILGGDSAGGALTITVLAALRDAGEMLPAGGLCICPYTDPAETHGSMKSNAEFDWAPEDSAELFQTYIDQNQMRDPHFSPIDADLTGLPPLLIQTGSAEVLYDQILAFAEKAKAAGVPTHLSIHADMIHLWHTMAAIFPESKHAIHECASFIRKQTTSVQ